MNNDDRYRKIVEDMAHRYNPREREPRNPPAYLDDPRACRCAPSPGGPHSASCPARPGVRKRVHLPCGQPSHRNGERCPAEPEPLDVAADRFAERVMIVCMTALGTAVTTGIVAGAHVGVWFAGYMIAGVVGVLLVLLPLLRAPLPARQRGCGCSRERVSGGINESLCSRHRPPGRAPHTFIPDRPTAPPPPPPAPRPARAEWLPDVDEPEPADEDYPPITAGPCPGCGHESVVRSPYTSVGLPPAHVPVDARRSRCLRSTTDVVTSVSVTIPADQPCGPGCVVVRDPDDGAALGRVHSPGARLRSRRWSALCPHDAGAVRCTLDPDDWDA